MGNYQKRNLEYLKSAKFLIGLGIMVILITLSTIINIHDFKQCHQDYLNAQQEMKGDSFYVQVGSADSWVYSYNKY